MMEASFIKERRDAEYQIWSLMVEEELAKAQARAEIYENESKISQSRKTKPLTPNDIHTTKEYPLQKILMKQKKTKCRMRSGRECSRPSSNQSHLIWQLYQMLIQEGI